MNYTRSILSSPYPSHYFDLGKQGVIQWKIGEEGSEVNKDFLNRLEKKGKNSSKLFSTVDASESFFEKNSYLDPSLFIFHLSRCGSTFASNYFATNPENKTFNEPSFLIQFIRTHWEMTAQNIQKLRLSIQLLGCGAMPYQKRLIIKTTSNFIKKFAAVDSLYPTVPKIFIYRDPKEVLISLLEGQPAYLPSIKNGEEQLIRKSIAHLELIFEHAIKNKSKFYACINYTDLKKDIRIIESNFGWENNSDYRLSQLQLIELQDSKNKNEKFIPDSINKQIKWREIESKYQISIQKLENQFKTIANL
jgi:hypothetical protein